MAEQISVLGGAHHPDMAAAANNFINDIAHGVVDISGGGSQAFRPGNRYGRFSFRVSETEIAPRRPRTPVRLNIYVEVQFRGWKPVAGTNQVFISNDVDNTLNGDGQDRNNWINNYLGYRVALFGRLR